MIRKLFFAVFSLGLSFACIAAPLDIIRVGINESDLSKVSNDFLPDLKDRLSKALPDYGISFIVLTEQQLIKAVDTRFVDLVFSSSAIFRRLVYKGRDLATLTTDLIQNPDKAEGAAVFVSAEHSELRSFSDLKNKSIGINFSEESIPSLALKWEMSPLSNNLGNYFKKTINQSSDISELLTKLKKNEIQAIALPVCSLEEYSRNSPVDTSWLRVLNRKSDSTTLCVHSTKLFPNLTLFELPHTSPDVARSIILTLTAVKGDKYSWTSASDYSQMDRLLRHFDLDPYAESRKWSVKRIFNEYWEWFLVVGILVLGLILHGVRAEALVKKRTKSLEESLEERSRLHKQAQQFAKKIEHLQKMGTLGQMSSLFAHELRQPLNSIICFSYSLAKNSPSKISQKQLKDGLNEIQIQAKRANDIVTKVRTYIQSKSLNRQVIDINEILSNSIYEFGSTSPISMSFIWENGQKFNVLGDPLELELVFINLFRNAAEAQTKMSSASVTIKLVKNDDSLLVSIADNGPKADNKLIQQLSTGIESSKPEGLGLGLSIVRMLLESHSGSIEFKANSPQGLIAIVKLPLATSLS